MVAVNLFCLLAIVSRNPEPSRWKSETLVANLFMPMLIFIGIGGLIFIVDFFLAFEEEAFSWLDGGLALGVILIGSLLVKSMRLKKRFAEFEQLSTAIGATPVIVFPTDDKPEPEPITRKAA